MKSIGTIVLVSFIVVIVYDYAKNKYNESKTSIPASTN
jgi:hypothetical protein